MALEGRHRHRKKQFHWDYSPDKKKKARSKIRLIMYWVNWRIKGPLYYRRISLRKFYETTSMINFPYYFE